MSWCRTKLWNQPQEAATTSIVDTVMGAEDDEYSIGDEDEFNEDDDLNGAGYIWDMAGFPFSCIQLKDPNPNENT
ncbi:hypothetical protein R6Q59_014301 [Mikania micrantha]